MPYYSSLNKLSWKDLLENQEVEVRYKSHHIIISSKGEAYPWHFKVGVNPNVYATLKQIKEAIKSGNF